jgi:hypothetical protein
VVPEARMIWARRWDRLWGLWLLAVFVLLPLAAWMQHIYTATVAERWFHLVLGAVVFPIGIVNGLAIWLGFAG